VDRYLGLPEEGEVSDELEKRIVDFGVNETFEDAAERSNSHYPEIPISSNLVRRVVDRVGRHLEAADPQQLELNLKPPRKGRDDLVVVQTDGSMLPIRGAESWKEVKVGVIVRPYEAKRKRTGRRDARFVAVLGQQSEFSRAMENALEVEQVHASEHIVWVGDGAASNWTLAGTLCPQAIQILDWYHAVEHVMTCGRTVLGETNPLLNLWRKRCEALLRDGQINELVDELMNCILDASDDELGEINDLIRYLRTNQSRMSYDQYIARGFPIGSGIAESAHRHVLQLRMKRAGQRWGWERARRMTRGEPLIGRQALRIFTARFARPTSPRNARRENTSGHRTAE